MQERECSVVQTFPVLGEPAASVQPSDGPLHDPALGQDDKALRRIRALDDLDLDPAHDAAQPSPKLRSCVAAIGIQLEQERVGAEQRRHQQHAAISVLDVSRMDDGVQQQALRVDKDVALLALDPFARIKAGRVDAPPPFSALFTL